MTELHYQGCNFFRQRLVLALFSGKTVRISDIRPLDDEPGLKGFEIAFVKLLDALTNGTHTEINDTGTEVLFSPGILIGGATPAFDCGVVRGVSYFLEPVMQLAPFCKHPVSLTLTGVTDPPGEPSVSPAMANRVIDAAKGALHGLRSDVYIASDHRRGDASGRSPGFGISLHAETTEGVVYCGEAVSMPKGSDQVSTPEKVGRLAACRLLERVHTGGCCDVTAQSLAALYMALTPRDVSVLLSGSLTPYAVQMLRHLRDFLGVVFKIDPVDATTATPVDEKTKQKKIDRETEDKDKEDDEGEESDSEDDEPPGLGADKLKLTCVGSGYSNLSKTVL